MSSSMSMSAGDSSGATLAEMARARLNEARAKARLEARAKAKADAEKARDEHAKAIETAGKWNDWQDTFYTCGPTRLALGRGVSSTAPKQQSTWLKRAEDIESKKRAAMRIVERNADPAVLAVIDLQNYDGKWLPSPQLAEALGGFPLPLAPNERVSQDLWTTALALAFLRRRPDQFDACTDAYERAQRWVDIDSDKLLEAARRALPPMNSYFELDHDAVREGRWRDSEALTFARDGYEGFTRPRQERCAGTPTEPPVGHVGSQPVVARTDRTSGRSKVTSQKKFSAHQQHLELEFKQLTKGSGPRTTAMRGGRNVDALRSVWEQSSGVRAETQRLENYQQTANKRTDWNSDFLGIRDVKPKRLRPPRKKREIPPPPPRPLIGEDGDLSYLFETVLGKDESRGGASALGRAVGQGDVDDDDEDGVEYMDMVKAVGASQLEVDNAQKNVVSAVAAYDAYVAEVAAKAAESSAAWRTSRLRAERSLSFLELTEMLGPYREARAGFDDWRAQPVLGLQTLTIALVNSVLRWRAALANMGRPSQVPFVWENRNVLLSIITALDFLGEQHPELREWYTEEFVFHRNPFSRACCLDERPPTPPSAKMKVLVDGEMVETINERLLAQNEAAQEVVGAWEAKMADAPKWWIDQGTTKHKRRIRAAEKVLLEEERLFGHLQEKVPPPPMPPHEHRRPDASLENPKEASRRGARGGNTRK